MRNALTGGIACGKSLLSRFLKDEGVETLDADEVVHSLESPGGEAAAPILSRFGTLDRADLAAIVFADPAARHDLEAILFPLVKREMIKWCDEAPQGVIRVAEIPLLFESHWDADFDTICAVTAPEEEQVKRMVQNRGMSRDQAISRIKVQMPVAEKAKRASYVIENNGDINALRTAVSGYVKYLTERNKK